MDVVYTNIFFRAVIGFTIAKNMLHCSPNYFNLLAWCVFMICLHNKFLKALVLAICVLCGSGLGAMAVTICGACGYENADTAKFCSHCGEKLTGKKHGKAPRKKAAAADAAASEAASPKGDAAEADTLNGPLSIENLRDEMKMADLYTGRHKYEVAILFAQNALAFNMILPKDDNARYKAIMNHIRQYKNAASTARNVCPDCNGSGVAVLNAHTIGSVDSATFGVKTAGMRCKRCGGTGYIRGGLTVDERQHSIGMAFEEYRTIQQSRGMVPVGQVWVPKDVVDKLGVRQRVALKRAVPPVCSRCMGLGRVSCKECHGFGVVRCRAKGCVDGYVEDRDTSTKRSIGSGRVLKSHSVNSHKCTVCHGTGLVQCEKCMGKGSFVCKHCNGSGCAPLCSKCAGEGIVKCRRCRGTGKYRGKVCPYCHGEGIAECSSCNGTGRRK